VAAHGHGQLFLIDGKSLAYRALFACPGLTGDSERHGDKSKTLAPTTYPGAV
jgi:5'-3' exonuclease